MIDSLEVDGDGYPSEAALEEIRRLREATPQQLQEFMLYSFVPLAEEIRMGTVRAWWRTDELFGCERLRIEFTTGGWSGCEDFIDAVLSVPMIRMCYYYMWRRGGYFAFEVPPLPEKKEEPPDELTASARRVAAVVFGVAGYLAGSPRRIRNRVWCWWHDHLAGL